MQNISLVQILYTETNMDPKFPTSIFDEWFSVLFFNFIVNVASGTVFLNNVNGVTFNKRVVVTNYEITIDKLLE